MYLQCWTKGNYTQCGWRLEKLEGEILEVKVTSSNVPLRFRIRDIKNKNETSWVDDGKHVFRINLKTKKMQSNGVFKEGKKTVVEYIKVE